MKNVTVNLADGTTATLPPPRLGGHTIHAIPARDWQHMGWYQREKWIRYYGLNHRTIVDYNDPKVCACGNGKHHLANKCRACYQRERARSDAELAYTIEQALTVDPDATIADISAQLGIKYISDARRRLRNAGRMDLHRRLIDNGKARARQKREAAA